MWGHILTWPFSFPGKGDLKMSMEHKTFEAQIKESNEKDLTVTHFISTESKDRGGDIMRAKGMKIKGKPVVLMSHGRGPTGSEPIAKPVWIKQGMYKSKPGIMAKTKFYPDDMGKRIWEKTVDGYMPNWSIGYMIIKAEDIDNYRGRDVKEWELLEYSPVGVPMNPDAQTIKGVDLNEIRFKIMPEKEETKEIEPEEKAEEIESEKSGEEEEIKDPQKNDLSEQIQELNNQIKILTEKIDTLGVLPASPEAGEKDEEGKDENPPENQEKKTAPRRLRIIDPQAIKESKKKIIIPLIKKLIEESVKIETNKILGKVP
jgi:hypothetical protein